MTKRILIDAVHHEEVRVAVADNLKLVEFEFESSEKRQIKSNIYLGKITRVEPSLQAAFVEYGGNRQGFLPFSEIHHDYFQIPIEDKEKISRILEDENLKEQKLIEEEEERFEKQNANQSDAQLENQEGAVESLVSEVVPNKPASKPLIKPSRPARHRRPDFIQIPEGFTKADLHDLKRAEELMKEFAREIMGEEYFNEHYGEKEPEPIVAEVTQIEEDEPQQEPEIIDIEERESNVNISRTDFYKQYKIQEVIKRNQIVLVQVVKEERGNKGASLTTFLALAGRYCVFMPNTEKGGGVSRRISNFGERKRIRQIIRNIEIQKGASVIIRTAGMEKGEEDINKDYQYLTNLWANIRKQTLESTAPAVVYKESDIVKRSLRDLFKGDVEEVIIEGEDSYREAKTFIELVSPSQAHMIKEHKFNMPIFQKYRIEERLDELYEPEVKLESGGSIVITPTEALVSIDVNSGKATKERSVEDTALKTNIEAAREIARQLRLRDLAGLVVIDFIDMRELRNRKTIEKELKDALKTDRAKIQIGRISTFGLLEMSRQRLHSSLSDSSSVPCPMCKGIGIVRSNESLTLKVIRAIEAEATRKGVSQIILRASPAIFHSITESKMKDIKRIESYDGVKITLEQNNNLLPNQYEISSEKGKKFNPKRPSHRPDIEANEVDSDEATEIDFNSTGKDLNKVEPEKGQQFKRSPRFDRGDRPERNDRNDRGPNGDRKPRRNNRRKNRPYKSYDANDNLVSFNVNEVNDHHSGGANYENESGFGDKNINDIDGQKSSKLIGLWKKFTG